MAGFQDTRDYFTELFKEYNEELVAGLMVLIQRGNVKAKEVEALVDSLYSGLGMREKIYDKIWELITYKVRPAFKRSTEHEDDEELNALLVLFLANWDSFGMKLPKRIRNTRRIIREELYKTAKTAVKGAGELLDDPTKSKGDYGLTKKELKDYERANKRSEAQGRAYVEGKVREKVQAQTEKKNVKTNRYYIDRAGETEALTIRMELELEQAKKTREVDFITIDVKPNACAICTPFIGKVYSTRTVPHLLVHPNCRCDYIVHYKSGDVLKIEGSGRIDLVNADTGRR